MNEKDTEMMKKLEAELKEQGYDVRLAQTKKFFGEIKFVLKFSRNYDVSRGYYSDDD